jgi:hypothetical protein
MTIKKSNPSTAVKQRKNAKKPHPLNGVKIDSDLIEEQTIETIDEPIKENINITIEETNPVFSDDEEEKNETIEEEEEDEDLKQLRLLEEQQQALKMKLKQKEAKKNILPLRKTHIDAFKTDLIRKEEELKYILKEIEGIKQSILDTENGDFDDLLIKMEIHKNEVVEKPKTKNGVKKEKVEKITTQKVANPKGRPKNLTECFKRDTLLHHNKSGINEYAFVYAVNGMIYPCDENMENKEGGKGMTLNGFTEKNYAEKNKREGTNRTISSNAYTQLNYKNDDGIWCSCNDLKTGVILTK